MQRYNASRLALTSLIATWVLAMIGCQSSNRLYTVPIDGPELAGATPAAVDVTNWQGSVLVVVEPEIKHATVQARVELKKGLDHAHQQAALEAIHIAATTSQEGGRSVLRVLAENAGQEQLANKAHVKITMPACEGVQVHNAGGPVRLVDVGGAITVENGADGSNGGWIELLSGSPITGPVTLTTADGSIHFQTPPGTTGRFDLGSPDGPVQFKCEAGEVHDVVASHTHWQGVLNGGENRVTLRTARGRVRVMIIKNAGTYVPSAWRQTRIIGR